MPNILLSSVIDLLQVNETSLDALSLKYTDIILMFFSTFLHSEFASISISISCLKGENIFKSNRLISSDT